MELIKLYVDQLSDDNKIGIVTNADTIRYNRNKMKLSEDFTNKIISDNEAAECGMTGTYLFIVGISLDKCKFQMFFIDYQYPKIWELIENNFNPDYQEVLRHYHSHIVANYKSYSGQTILLIGEDPPEMH